MKSHPLSTDRVTLIRFIKRRCIERGITITYKSGAPIKFSAMVQALGGPAKNSRAFPWADRLWQEAGCPEVAQVHLPRVPGARALAEARAGSKEFYASAEWRALRFAVLKMANGRCNLCGRSTREHGVVLHVDHIKPRSIYPELELSLSNLQILCEDCNLGKGNRDDTDWRVGRPD